ncbi:hypothetical protein [Butyrivibrio sp. XPD2006]|uniref:hypothetical protein n=1 Tax=Butyrivibrio sp. XPD2006 TaxID=1280668 RepID=UPI0003B457C8|nr:hypothetical protein [Butyrivibrio sp. XPD2006]
MVKVLYSLDEGVLRACEAELAALGARELSGCENLLKPEYIDGDVTCSLVADDKQVRFIVAGAEGVFKDVFLPLNKSVKFYAGDAYDFICSLEKKLILTIKNDSYTEGNREALIAFLRARSGDMTDAEIAQQKAHQEAMEQNEQRKNAEKFYRPKEAKGSLPRNKTQLKDRFRTQGYFAIAFAIFGMIDSIDGMFFGRGVFDPMNTLFAGLRGLVIGFFFSFTYTFFRAWFDNQKEKVRIGSIVLFFITFPAFTIMGVLGAIPYSVYQIVDGKRTRGVTRVINIAVPIFMGLVLIAELGLLYFIFGMGMFL